MQGLLYVLEHRYYGASQPFEDWSTQNLKYLSANYALADIAQFIDSQNEWIIDSFGGSKRQWVVVGGSYPGALSAWFKSKYPDHAVASWSSSGVIHAIKDFYDFDKDIYTATLKSGPECPAAIQKVTEYVEKVFREAENGQ